MVDRGLTLAVLPPSPAKVPPSPTLHEAPRRRHRLARPPTRREVERRAQRLCSLLQARAIRAGVIFSSAMHGRRYSRREQSGPAPEERVARRERKKYEISSTHRSGRRHNDFRCSASVCPVSSLFYLFSFISFCFRFLFPKKIAKTGVNDTNTTLLEKHNA